MIARLWAAMLKAAPLRLWAMILGAPVVTALAGTLIWIVWKGGWDASLQAVQLNILGWTLYIAMGLITVIIVSLASVSVKARGPGDTGIEIDGDGK